MIAPTLAQFRADFPAFANTTTFPDASVNFWLNWAQYFLLNSGPYASTPPPCAWTSLRWGQTAYLGIELFTAHNCVLDARDAKLVAGGGLPGGVSGPLTASAVDKVSKSMDPASITLTDGGYWNATSFGIRFLQLARAMGAGPVEIGAGGTQPSAFGIFSGNW